MFRHGYIVVIRYGIRSIHLNLKDIVVVGLHIISLSISSMLLIIQLNYGT